MSRHVSRDPLGRRRLAAGLLAWLLFGLAWWYVATRPGSELLSWQLVVLPGSLATVAALNALWVRHNRRIYQVKGPRRAVPAAPGTPARDRLGRSLALDLPAARTAAEVVVEVVGGRKTYRTVPS